MSLIIGIMLVLLGIFVCISILPFISNYISNKNNEKETVYEFSKELIDCDYPDIKLFEKEKEKFERKKQQVFSQELPWYNLNTLNKEDI